MCLGATKTDMKKQYNIITYIHIISDTCVIGKDGKEAHFSEICNWRQTSWSLVEIRFRYTIDMSHYDTLTKKSADYPPVPFGFPENLR